MKKGIKEAVRELFDCYREIEALKEKPSHSPEFLRWRRSAEALVGQIFGEESDQARDFKAIYYSPLFLSCRTGDAEFDEAYREGLEQARKMIVSWIETMGREPGS